MTMESSHSWPRRRSPLPATVLYGTPSRRRYKVDSSLSAHRLFLDTASVCSDSTERWDSETVLSRTPSPDTTGYDNIRVLSLQVKQQRYEIDELTRQLELQETETAKYIQTVDKLKTEVDEGHRRTQAERQEHQRYEKLVSWYEEQQKLQQREATQTESNHRSVLRVTERRHHNAIKVLLAKLANVEEQSEALTDRIGYLSEQLDMARSETKEVRTSNAVHIDQLHDARLAAAQADELAADLAIRLKERCAYVEELEQRLWQLVPLTAALPDYVSPENDCAKVVPSNIHHVNGISLFIEISKATNTHTQLAPQQLSRTYNPMLQSTGAYNISNCTDALRVSNSAPKDSAVDSLLQIQNQHQHQPEGILHWLAVYTHMLWSLYLQLWLRPVLRLLGIVMRIALGFVVPETLLFAWLGTGGKVPHIT
ncbi:hypothetical protein COEREDRAFT_6749 [Coemansia reversa NRRL 1564]|uniref:Uncharacterized protein n=1 Tax=Coemansia reversa (strain ATCC 12441 / NRRL 1564) TaxID=763665 RepID=A0A2G5BG99_COERN|nr:hypothetical protein COEREDRAFT_6749 [Coemansia reversa NRRL 1564]|eukprot:PIA18002.1 hypothetical protein COEREDRAFT_6749 [Coemansia reversa NRRL 1564]